MEKTFGSYLRELRLKKCHGLRSFAKEIGWLPSNYSNLENDKINPPRDTKMLFSIAEALQLRKDSEEWAKLFDLAADSPERAPADIVKYVNESELMPLMLRTVANKKLSKGQIKKLIEDIKKI
ncbi:MAG: helix-turn-helix transcriptional regulator [Candidatus Omnitrophota bacterium]|nr:helix-turn-helix transcriptional regulator [Candidatus Omnitrophota bacterium]